MHKSYVIFLIVIIYSALNDGALGVKNIRQPTVKNTLPHTLTQEKTTIATKRLLRYHVPVDLDETDKGGKTEERGILSNIFVKEKPDRLFKSLKLGRELDNAKLTKWLRYSRAYQKKHGDYAFSNLEIYFMLKEVVPDVTLAETLQTLKNTSGLKTVATRVQNVQFGDWLDQNLQIADVARMLGVELNLSPQRVSEVNSELSYQVFRDFTLYFVGSHLP
ncbi:Secreted RxLR effector peptide protein [Phytophthora palmivora]|uniref:RxLR effector protein n=1 Tax=Phytophthora palmivora TaxID=4796 RepID=A0A2P4Y9A4_9STRA|nr:Secreted RxLR effector peptide protein [Phytophthora palmivora]